MRISDWSSDVCSSDLRAVEGEEEAVLRRVVEHFGGLAVHRLLGEDDGLGRGIVPGFGRGFLIMPFIRAGRRIERDDRGEEPVVAFAVRARAVIPRIAIADAQLNLVEILVIEDRKHVVSGKSVSVLVYLGGRSSIKKNKNKH